VFSTGESKLHMASDRRLWFTHKCRICNYLFVCEKDLVHHEATHSAADFVCDSCCCVFDDEAQLNVHVNDGCSAADCSGDVSRQHVCGTCGEIFRFVRELYRHYGEQHMDDGSTLASRQPQLVDSVSVCAVCTAEFSGAASLKVHLWKAHSLNVVQQRDHILEKNGHSSNHVTACDDVADPKLDFSPLVMRAEDRERDKPYKCSMCNWSFKYDFSFHAHLKMHEEKQRLLEEMLRANCGSQTSVVGDVAEIDTGNLVSNSAEMGIPLILFPLKRKLQNSDDDADCLYGAKLSVGCDRKYIKSSCCIVTQTDMGADGERQLCGETYSDQQHSVDQTCFQTVSVAGAASELHQSPSLSPIVRNSSLSVVRKQSEEPLRFACKLCSFKCRYDFSYIAHLNQHDKLKELEIDDLQSHLVASSTQTPSSSHGPNKLAVKVIGSDDGGVSYVEGHSEVVDSSAVSYILLCPGAVDPHETAVMTSSHQQLQSESAITQSTSGAADCLDSSVVLVDVVNSNIGQGLDSATRPPASDVDDDVDFSVGPEMQFLDSTSGETLYVINEADLQVALPVDVNSDHQKSIVYEESETEVVSSLEPSSRQLLDMAGLCTDEDVHQDENDSAADEESFICYYCNAAFNNKSELEQHILRLHVD